MKKKLLVGLVIGLFLVGMVGVASATVLTFDDTSYQGTYWGDMEAGYGGFNWSSNFDVYYGPGVGGGYNSSTVSGDFAAFNSYGIDVSLSNGDFDWTGAWFSDPHDNTLLNVTGSLDGTILYYENIQLSYASPQWFQADWMGIDTIAFNLNGNDWFTMDDFTFNEGAPSPVPEPATMLLLGLGLLGVAGVARKKHKI
ncbi:MAG: PEP-CTERM sorting domain-containing protein [Desulfobacterales bacterium]|nr:PEP-CTERM sorting domain-containing protein [Desulfobacterales bacterium]